MTYIYLLIRLLAIIVLRERSNLHINYYAIFTITASLLLSILAVDSKVFLIKYII